MRRIAVIFDNRCRPETTGLYCRRALGQLVQARHISHVEHLLPDELEQVSPGQFDLFLYVDDGLQQDLRDDLRPAAWWAIDTHLGFERCLKLAESADWTFAAQRDGAEQLQAQGVKQARWLPLACDPSIHGRRATAEEFDFAFVGHIFPGPRQDLLERLLHEFPRTYVGQKYFEEMADVYSASKIVFNRSISNDVNMRVFEGLCSGAMLLTNSLRENGQDELFQEGVHFVTYAGEDELIDKAHYYLQHAEIRQRIATAGREAVLQDHTYRHRMESLLRTVSKAPQDSATVPNYMPQKEMSYFEFSRPDVLDLIPVTAERVLDIGCGAGRLGQSLQARQAASVVGVEQNPAAAQAAMSRIDQVLIGDICSEDIDFEEGAFDCVVCADVLEHLRHPETVLRKARRWLAPNGHLITSLPNVRNHTVVRSLLSGNWTYESAGLLDEDHVRFFTKREIEKLLFRCGFEIDELRSTPGDGYAEWERQGKSPQVTIGPFQLQAGSVEEAEEFFAYQYLTRATVRAQSELPLTSIILVTHNQLSYTKQCLDSIRLRTIAPYEIIVVDNGSNDQTAEYLGHCDDVRLISNRENRGFPAAVNQGIAAAQGTQVLLLNNDTLVTTGWLTRMLEALHSQADVGLVGPLSNNVSGEQQVNVTYDDLSQLDGFAWELSKQQHNQRVTTDRLVGFCLLFKRELVDRIGLFDEQFGIGNFEDDDFCRRAQESGYRCLIATDAFVHHFGSVTFRGSGVNLRALLQQNQELYQRKWNRERGTVGAISESAANDRKCLPSLSLPTSAPYATGHRDFNSASTEATPQHEDFERHPRPEFLCDVDESEALLLKENRVQLSACLIVRNNESTIHPCLESLVRWVDEIVVVDTGSTDATPEICRAYGARVYHWPWRDDFAAARNESLKYAFGEWIFWMDSDDTLPWECGEELRRLVDGEHRENVLGYIMQVHCPGSEPTDVTIVDHVKLIRNRPDLNFEFRIHEQILPAIRRAGGEVEWTDIYVVHSGATKDPSGRAKKLDRDYKLLHLELQEKPNHPFTLFNLGMTYADDGKHEQAIAYLNHSIDLSRTEESHLRKAYSLLVRSLSAVDNHREALEQCDIGLQMYQGDKELLFRKAMLLRDLGQLERAVDVYHQILRESDDRHFQSVDIGIADFKARHNLAVIYEELGTLEQAQNEWWNLVEAHPDYESGWKGLAILLIRNQDYESMRQVVNALSDRHFDVENSQYRNDGLKAIAAVVKARLSMSDGDMDRARSQLEHATSLSPNDCWIYNEYCHFLFGNDPAAAVEHLSKLASMTPDDGAVLHNLGVVCIQVGELDRAISALKKSLKLRPNSPDTEHQLSLAWEQKAQSELDSLDPKISNSETTTIF
ncbi:SPBc2 prophage-derived glycosyltransferase SunS [Thalassoglobus neptunius]|uniref:SPBc2 prophage-derived glycosyltransferase SunS n=1 Tax=Thalassoglobus neptunius TaxID=1938619 RepID=A0A5C5VWL1_9PLAN|nr:glycosyltransferase [Thalassoglobus neptunius]TWT43066.1 SPBc2 prophage-derived glycosyltransferase SunS [Thalassoglobus neptunius]